MHPNYVQKNFIKENNYLLINKLNLGLQIAWLIFFYKNIVETSLLLVFKVM